MTSDDIRQKHQRLIDDEPHNGREDWRLTKITSWLSHGCGMLSEIAAHLAEQKPRWVWLPLGDGRNGVFDANKIANVQPGNRPNMTIISDDWRADRIIFLPIEQVCSKLGIPMEINT